MTRKAQIDDAMHQSPRTIDIAKPPPQAPCLNAQILRARAIHEPFGSQCRTKVRRLPAFEPLSYPIIWKREQWAVTRHGVECRDGRYPIEIGRIYENEERYGWVRHMGAKGWVDIDDFAETLRIARHFVYGQINRTSLTRPFFPRSKLPPKEEVDRWSPPRPD